MQMEDYGAWVNIQFQNRKENDGKLFKIIPFDNFTPEWISQYQSIISCFFYYNGRILNLKRHNNADLLEKRRKVQDIFFAYLKDVQEMEVDPIC